MLITLLLIMFQVEITPTDEKEIEKTCEDMYVHVSADTFEKVDAAVALIELLVTPVSVCCDESLNPKVVATICCDANVALALFR